MSYRGSRTRKRAMWERERGGEGGERALSLTHTHTHTHTADLSTLYPPPVTPDLCYLFSPPNWCLKFTLIQFHLDKNAKGRGGSPISGRENWNFSCSPDLEYVRTTGNGAGDRFAPSKASPVLLKEGDSWVFSGHLIKSGVLGFTVPPTSVWAW